MTVDGDLINRCEMFDEEDIDAALARFDELDQFRPTRKRLDSDLGRLVDAYNRRDMRRYSLPSSTEDTRLDDRRKGLQRHT